MKLTIDYLAKHPDRLPEVASLHYGEWPSPQHGDSIEAREKVLATCCQQGALPLGVVALDGHDLCGFALLIRQDLERRMDLSPWLAGVLVRPKYRRKGIGSALVTRIEAEAAALSVETLYLYTSHSELLYRRLGWHVIERYENNSRNYAIMSKALSGWAFS
jgi:predicted N-acetyltransferase YhbS